MGRLARRALVAAAVLAVVGGGGVALRAATRPSPAQPVAASTVTAAPTPPAGTTPPAPSAPATSAAPKPTQAVSPVRSTAAWPLPAPPAYPQPCPPPPIPPGPPPPPMPPPQVAESALPPVAALKPRKVDIAPVTGKGIWLTTWPESQLDVGEVVRRSQAAGLRQVWIRTGGTRQGWYGDRFLATLLPAAHRAGIAVIAWDFPTLSDPSADAVRAKRALLGTWSGQRLDAFSPDIETKAEGVYLTERRVKVYLSRVRAYAGNRPVVSTVPRPTSRRLASYPYAVQVPYVDVFAPMVYWSCNEPGALVDQSMGVLRRWRPVHVVGQSYDMGPEGGRHGMPSRLEIWRFLDRTRRDGGVGASLYVYSQTGPAQWAALSRYAWS